MRILLTLILTAPAFAQAPLVSLRNASHPGSNDFRIGDRFEIVITASPHELVSVRTSRQGNIDWSPTIGYTDNTGHWSTTGQFDSHDFGDWKELWTVGGKLASPIVEFSVNPPCLPGGPRRVFMSGAHTVVTCETAEGSRTFRTPATSASFRTPDGRLVDGRAGQETQEQYHSDVLQHLMANGMGAESVALHSSRGGLGDETAELISKLIGGNALTEGEIRNTLAIVRAAFAKPETIQPTAREPWRTLLLLRHLDDITASDNLKREIGETIVYFQNYGVAGGE